MPIKESLYSVALDTVEWHDLQKVENASRSKFFFTFLRIKTKIQNMITNMIV